MCLPCFSDDGPVPSDIAACLAKPKFVHISLLHPPTTHRTRQNIGEQTVQGAKTVGNSSLAALKRVLVAVQKRGPIAALGLQSNEPVDRFLQHEQFFFPPPFHLHKAALDGNIEFLIITFFFAGVRQAEKRNLSPVSWNRKNHLRETPKS